MRSRFFPGYAVAAVSTVALVFTAPGQTLLVSLLNVPLREAYDIAPLTLNTAYTVATIAASLPLVWVGKLVDRYGPRKMFIAVALAFAGACLFTAAIAHTLMVFAAFFLLRFCGQGSLALVSSHALAMWFHRRLGTLTGLRAVVLFAAWAPLPSVTLLAIERFGWRATWAGFGVLVAATLSLLAWRFVHDRPEDLGLRLDGDDADDRTSSGPLKDPTAVAPAAAEPTAAAYSLAQARRTRSYWILVAGTALPPMIGTAILFDIQPLLARQGVDGAAAAAAVSVWSASMALLALPVGRLVDRFRPRWFVVIGSAAMATSCILLTAVHSGRAAMLAMAFYALGQSLIASTVGATAARYFGRRHHGAIRSSLSRLGVIATGVGPLLFGLSQRFTGGYAAALWLFAALCVPAAASAFLLAPPQAASDPA